MYKAKKGKIQVATIESFLNKKGQPFEKAVIKLEDGTLGMMSKKAMWSWLRFHYPRKEVDAELKGKSFEVAEIFIRRLNCATQRDDLQFITKMSDGYGAYEQVLAVATKNHTTIDPAKVELEAEMVLTQKGMTITRDKNLKGFVAVFKKTELKKGLVI